MTERERHLIEQIEHILVRERDLPRGETFSRLFADLEKSFQEHAESINKRMITIEKRLEIVDDIMKFGKISTFVFNGIVKSIVGIGILIGAIYSFKNWIR